MEQKSGLGENGKTGKSGHIFFHLLRSSARETWLTALRLVDWVDGAGDIRGKNFKVSVEQRNGAIHSVVPQRPFWGCSLEGHERRTGLFLRRDEAKLLHEAKRIVVAAVTDNLPIPDSIHITKPHFA